MRHRLNLQGFTVIETLIFLAVSTAVFTLAITQYTQQQKNVEYSTGVRNVQSLIDSMASETATSYGPSLNGTGRHCETDLVNNPPSFIVPEGDSTGCVYLGRAMAIGNDVFCSATNIERCSRYSLIPIVGRRDFYSAAGDPSSRAPASNLEQSKPVALATCFTAPGIVFSVPCGSPIVNGIGAVRGYRPDLAERKRFNNGIGIYRAYLRNSSGGVVRDIGGFAFFNGLSRFSTDSANNVNLVWLDTPFINNTESKATDAIENLGGAGSDTTYVNPLYGISLCIRGSDTKRSVITIGANGGQLDVKVNNSIASDAGCNI